MGRDGGWGEHLSSHRITGKHFIDAYRKLFLKWNYLALVFVNMFKAFLRMWLFFVWVRGLGAGLVGGESCIKLSNISPVPFSERYVSSLLQVTGSRSKIEHDKVLINCQYSMATFSTGERRSRSKGDRKSQEMQLHLKKTFEAAILTQLYPRSQIDIYVQVKLELTFLWWEVGNIV